MPIVDGIVSGFDTTGLIDAIVSTQRLPIQSMEGEIADLEAKREKIAGLSNRLEEFSSSIATLQDDDLRFFTTSSTTEDFEVTADPSAAEGNYRIRVTSLARGEVSRSQLYSSEGLGTLGQGTLSITYKGVQNDIVVDATNDGLAGLADSISEIDGLSAYVVDTGNGTPNPYRLVVKGESGSDAGIAFDSSGLSNSPKRITFQQRLSATDTVASIDNEAVRSKDNVIRGIPGLEIKVNNRNSSWQTLTVDNDLDTTVEKIQGFVDSYNEVLDYYGTNSVFNEELGLKGPLLGESGARRVIESLGSLVSNAYTVDGDLGALSQVGISTERSGKLELDTDALREQLETRRGDVEALFLSDTGPLAALRSKIDDVFVDPDSGTLANRSESIEGSITDLEDAILRKEDYLASYTQRLRDRFNSMEVALAGLQSSGAFLAAMIPAK